LIEILDGVHETVDYKGNFGLRLYRNIETEDFPTHWHLEVEIIMPLKNHYTVVTPEQTVTVEPGEIAVVSSGELHSLRAPDSGSRLILLADCSSLYEFPGIHFAVQMLPPCLLIRPGQIPGATETHGLLSSLLNKIDEEYFSENPFREAACYAYMTQFFVILGRTFWNTEEKQSSESAGKKNAYYIDRFLEVCNYINAHCTNPITLEELASIAGFNKFHFSRLFKQYMNISYHEYLTKRRIMHAEKLLINPGCSIMQASLQSGFNSLSTFNRVFKSYKKCTPTEFIAFNHAEIPAAH